MTGRADVRLGMPGVLCALFVSGRVVGLVRRGGLQYSVMSVTEGKGESVVAVCKSYALARAALMALHGVAPAQGRSTSS